MTSFKQLEAIVAVAEAGSFSDAAHKLGVVQSAISRQVQELENHLKCQLLNRSARQAKFTKSGQEVLSKARGLLQQRDLIVDQMINKTLLSTKVRLGVTELTAMTWLPVLIEKLKEEYAAADIEIEVEASTVLLNKLKTGALDIIIVPDAFNATGLIKTKLADVQSAWLCHPSLHNVEADLPVSKIGNFTSLVQNSTSGAGIIMSEWMEKRGIVAKTKISTNSLTVLVGIVLAGLGVAYLPRNVFTNLLADGQLKEIISSPPVPSVSYVAIIPTSKYNIFHKNIISLMQAICNFDRLHQKHQPFSVNGKPGQP
ncbi:LysR family transcriptional regulator [Paralcaligenes sp. KSB-10]|uniref:LysR family transcriptional regulator n=1 Tax=Paralcaligenes sp. KSB-10 TaxID=2901142 RepID=UPI001E60F470|nr:LysR family transcriptional regulator [Paralcaligenes sp. KSB-10]UHL65657.1 LysR family transcriptional regulator [Paralcaligenes sp. KSB-10]